LVQGAYAQVADLLAFGRLARSHWPMCPNRLFDLRHYLHDNAESDSITTLFRRVVGRRVGLYPKTTTRVPRYERTLLRSCVRIGLQP
jgi:hypothetical protein